MMSQKRKREFATRNAQLQALLTAVADLGYDVGDVVVDHRTLPESVTATWGAGCLDNIPPLQKITLTLTPKEGQAG